MSVENPGSLQEFAKNVGLPIGKALGEYTLRLDAYRQQLAEFYQVSLDELHDGATLHLPQLAEANS